MCFLNSLAWVIHLTLNFPVKCIIVCAVHKHGQNWSKNHEYEGISMLCFFASSELLWFIEVFNIASAIFTTCRYYGKRANLKMEGTRIQSMPNFPKNEHFSENMACFVFLLPPVWDMPFCHITDELPFHLPH